MGNQCEEGGDSNGNIDNGGCNSDIGWYCISIKITEGSSGIEFTD